MSDSSEKRLRMRQYLSIRSELPEQTLLMFRLGDFCEMFFEDASAGASILNISLPNAYDTDVWYSVSCSQHLHFQNP